MRMNKKLRRLLGRRRRNEDKSDSAKQEQKSLPSLLGKRANVEPNYYCRRDQTDLENDLVQKVDLVSKEEGELIAIPDAHNDIEKSVHNPTVENLDLNSEGKDTVKTEILDTSEHCAISLFKETKSAVDSTPVNTEPIERDATIATLESLESRTRIVAQQNLDQKQTLHNCALGPFIHSVDSRVRHEPEAHRSLAADENAAEVEIPSLNGSQPSSFIPCYQHLNCSCSMVVACSCGCGKEEVLFLPHRPSEEELMRRHHNRFGLNTYRNQEAEFQQQDSDWGWVSPAGTRPSDASDSGYDTRRTLCPSRSSNNSLWHHCRCATTSPHCIRGPVPKSTLSQAKEKWHHSQPRGIRHRFSRSSSFRCRNKQGATCHLHQRCCLPCAECSSAHAHVPTRRFQISTKILFTIVDEDALERRPRVLEFGCHPVADNNHVMDSANPSASEPYNECVQGGLANNCETMEWLEDEREPVFPLRSFSSLSTSGAGNCFNHHQSKVATPFGNLTSGHQPSDMTIAFNGTSVAASPSSTHQLHFRSGYPSCCARQPNQRSSCRMGIAHSCHEAHPSPVLWGESNTTLAHFELSKRAYAKLLAYCHSKQLLSNLYSSPPTLPGGLTQMPSVRLDDGVEPRSLDKDVNADNAGELSLSQSGDHFKPYAAEELCRLARVFETVEDCPWYFGAMSGQEAKIKLRGTPNGTFLLRDSSDSRYLFSLSLMTARGPTSIRIVYSDGTFHFESEQDESTGPEKKSTVSDRRSRSRRECAVRMILHYTSCISRSIAAPASVPTHSNSNPTESSPTTRTEDGTASESGRFMCYWMGREGRREIPVQLTRPIDSGIPSLQHLTRTSLNRHCRLWENPFTIANLPLPYVLRNYISKYPYPV